MTLLTTLRVVGSSDTTPPISTIISGPSKIRVSRVAGQNTSDVSWSANEAFTSYQVRVVPGVSSPVTAGQLLEQDQSPAAGGAANTTYTFTVTDAELTAALAVEGANVLKIFARDAAGNWSI